MDIKFVWGWLKYSGIRVSKMAEQVKKANTALDNLSLSPGHPHDSLQPSVTPVTVNPMPSSGLFGHVAQMRCTDIHSGTDSREWGSGSAGRQEEREDSTAGMNILSQGKDPSHSDGVHIAE